MTGNLEAFTVERDANVLIVSPQGDSHGFRFETVHYEYNLIHRMLADPDVVNLLIDLESVEFMGSIMINVLIRLTRVVTDRNDQVAMCSCSEQMKEILDSQNLFRLWPYFETRSEALASFES